MKTTVSFYDFLNAWQSSDSRKDSFSRSALVALWDYLEELEEQECLGEDFDPLDIVALDCEYIEYKTFDEIQSDHPNVWDYQALVDVTQVIEFDGGIIIQQF